MSAVNTFREERKKEGKVMEAVYATLHDHGMQSINVIFDCVTGKSEDRVSQRELNQIFAILRAEQVTTGKYSKSQ